MSVGSNFAAGPARQLEVHVTPTQFELLLQDLELTEEDALWLLRRPGTKAMRLRLWIAKHHAYRYVPVKFLSQEQMDNCR